MTASQPRLLESNHASCQINADNLALFAQILNAQRNGYTCLPCFLGLSEQNFLRLVQTSSSLLRASTNTLDPAMQVRNDLRQELLDLRRDEWQDLVNLFVSFRRHQDESEIWMAHMVAAACMGSEHLWRDLGMASRDQLRHLLTVNFPQLVFLNHKDMRWKKFFYKQLCEQEGGYVCRSPTCETCPTYDDCFGDES